MTLKETIEADFKQAVKTNDALGRAVLSMLKAALHNKAIEKKQKDTPLPDEEVMDVILSEIKKRRDAAAQFASAGRAELAQKEEAEAAVLMRYLPAQLAESEISAAVSEAIAATGAAGIKETGKVLGLLSKKLKGKADMSRVAQIVKDQLSG